MGLIQTGAHFIVNAAAAMAKLAVTATLIAVFGYLGGFYVYGPAVEIAMTHRLPDHIPDIREETRAAYWVIKTSLQENETPVEYGTLRIEPSPGITYEMPVYAPGTYSYEAMQAIVDDPETALIRDDVCGMRHTVADHASDGFIVMGGCLPGARATMTLADGRIQILECRQNLFGHNTTDDITDGRYTSLSTYNSHDYMLYTCLDETGEDIAITLWDVVDTI